MVIVKIKKILNNFFMVVGSFSYRLTGLRDPGLNCVPVASLVSLPNGDAPQIPVFVFHLPPFLQIQVLFIQ